MQMVFLSQDDRFYVRLTPEGCTRFPDGAFNPGVNAPVYALRVDGEGERAKTWFLVLSSEGEFFWIRSADVRLARR
jgi:hypothetical protein